MCVKRTLVLDFQVTFFTVHIGNNQTLDAADNQLGNLQGLKDYCQILLLKTVEYYLCKPVI